MRTFIDGNIIFDVLTILICAAAIYALVFIRVPNENIPHFPELFTHGTEESDGTVYYTDSNGYLDGDSVINMYNEDWPVIFYTNGYPDDIEIDHNICAMLYKDEHVGNYECDYKDGNTEVTLTSETGNVYVYELGGITE